MVKYNIINIDKGINKICIFCGKPFSTEYCKNGKKILWFHSECYEFNCYKGDEDNERN